MKYIKRHENVKFCPKSADMLMLKWIFMITAVNGKSMKKITKRHNSQLYTFIISHGDVFLYPRTPNEVDTICHHFSTSTMWINISRFTVNWLLLWVSTPPPPPPPPNIHTQKSDIDKIATKISKGALFVYHMILWDANQFSVRQFQWLDTVDWIGTDWNTCYGLMIRYTVHGR